MAPRGICPICGKSYALRLAGNRPVVRRHGQDGLPATRGRGECPGAGQPAKTDAR